MKIKIFFGLSIILLLIIGCGLISPRPSHPALVVDSENNAQLFWTEDTKRNDGQGDVLYYSKISKEGKRIVNKEKLYSSLSIYEPVSLISKNNEISLFWFDPSEMENFNANSFPQIGKVYWMKVDSNGKIISEAKAISEAKQINEDLIDSNKLIELSGDNSIHQNKALHWKIEVSELTRAEASKVMGENIPDIKPKQFIRFKDSIDSSGNTYIFSKDCDVSESFLGIPFVCVKKLDSTNELVFNKKIFSRPVPKNCKGFRSCVPSFYSEQLKLDNEHNIHITFYMNNGFNRFSIHYIKLDHSGNLLIEDMKIA